MPQPTGEAGLSHLVADDGGNRHAVKHVVDELVKNAAVCSAKHNGTLVLKTAGAVLSDPAIHVSRLVVAPEQHPLEGMQYFEGKHVPRG